MAPWNGHNYFLLFIFGLPISVYRVSYEVYRESCGTLVMQLELVQGLEASAVEDIVRDESDAEESSV